MERHELFETLVEKLKQKGPNEWFYGHFPLELGQGIKSIFYFTSVDGLLIKICDDVYIERPGCPRFYYLQVQIELKLDRYEGDKYNDLVRLLWDFISGKKREALGLKQGKLSEASHKVEVDDINSGRIFDKAFGDGSPYLSPRRKE